MTGMQRRRQRRRRQTWKNACWYLLNQPMHCATTLTLIVVLLPQHPPASRMRTYAAAAFFVALCAAASLSVFKPQSNSGFKPSAQANSGFTFNVDPVELDLEPVTRRQLDPVDLCRGAWGSQLEACYLSSALSTKHCFYGLSTNAFNRHGLIYSFLTSFTKHKRLVLRPDDIFFPLLDAAATHVFQQGSIARASIVPIFSISFRFFCRRRSPEPLRESHWQKGSYRRKTFLLSPRRRSQRQRLAERSSRISLPNHRQHTSWFCGTRSSVLHHNRCHYIRSLLRNTHARPAKFLQLRGDHDVRNTEHHTARLRTRLGRPSRPLFEACRDVDGTHTLDLPMDKCGGRNARTI